MLSLPPSRKPHSTGSTFQRTLICDYILILFSTPFKLLRPVPCVAPGPLVLSQHRNHLLRLFVWRPSQPKHDTMSGTPSPDGSSLTQWPVSSITLARLQVYLHLQFKYSSIIISLLTRYILRGPLSTPDLLDILTQCTHITDDDLSLSWPSLHKCL